MSAFQTELERCPILQGFDDTELLSFLERVQHEDFPAGQDILTEGKAYRGLWVLLKGKCEVIKQGRSRESRLAILEPGHVFGEMSFFEPVPHSATVRSMTEVETIRLLPEQYQDLLDTCPTAAHAITVNVIRILSDRLRRMDDWTCELVEKECDRRKYHEWQDFRAKLYTEMFN
jgi:CRP/FNR family transcriptional regulator, cyclic AMP receptor protein